jgi:hypothetical protein
MEVRLGSGGGEGIPASLVMTNVSGRQCALTGYVILKWRDASGAVIPVTISRRPDPQTPHTVAVRPGENAVAGLNWQRYQKGTTTPCPPFPKTLDVWLPPTVQNPHPDQGPAAHVAWVTGDSAGLCGGKAELTPVDVIR